MKARFLSIMVALFSMALFSNSSQRPNEITYWNTHEKLALSDFKGQPDYTDPHIIAMTYSGVLFYTECDEYLLEYDVQSYFDKDESWVKLEARTPHHLQHEQLHFDITELYTRRLKAELAKETFYCGEEERFNRFVDDFLATWQTEQHRYDIETGYSNHHTQQTEWEYKIALELSMHDHAGHTHEEEHHDIFFGE